jgi:hypothetical protein
MALYPNCSSNDLYKPRNTNAGFMITSLNFCSHLFMNFKQELQRVLHDRSSDSQYAGITFLSVNRSMSFNPSEIVPQGGHFDAN